MPGVKTNEVPGTRAVLRHYRMSAYKARQVLDLIRGRDADRAEEILNATPREAARVVGKVLASAVANARNNDQLDPDELYVSACYADEGTTLKRWRPRARGRATRIRKRTLSHHGDREPAARRPARTSPVPPGHRDLGPALAPGGRLASPRRRRRHRDALVADRRCRHRGRGSRRHVDRCRRRPRSRTSTTQSPRRGRREAADRQSPPSTTTTRNSKSPNG